MTIFLTENNFHPLPHDPTNKDQMIIHKALQQCDQIIDKKQIKHLIQKNPTPTVTKCATQITQTQHSNQTSHHHYRCPLLQNSQETE